MLRLQIFIAAYYYLWLLHDPVISVIRYDSAPTKIDFRVKGCCNPDCGWYLWAASELSLVPSWTPRVMTEPGSALWHEICWASPEWAGHIPSKLAGKCTEMPKNMTRIMIRFVLTVATVILTEGRARGEKSEGWLQIWWYLEIRASQVNNNKQFGIKSTRNWTSCLHWKQANKKKLTWKLWPLFWFRGMKMLSPCGFFKCFTTLFISLVWRLKVPGPLYFDCKSWYHPRNNLNGDGGKKSKIFLHPVHIQFPVMTRNGEILH